MLRIQWTAAGGPVTGYIVQYVPLTGLGQQIIAERQEVSTSLTTLYCTMHASMEVNRSGK